MGPLLVGKPLLDESAVPDWHAQHHKTSLLLRSFAFPSLSSKDVQVLGFDGRTIPNFGLAEINLDPRCVVESVLDLQKDLCNAIRIAQHVYVVEVGEKHLTLTQSSIDLQES